LPCKEAHDLDQRDRRRIGGLPSAWANAVHLAKEMDSRASTYKMGNRIYF